ncbi:MAG: calcium/sodium antiporter [Polyangiaceae bacterium]|nr:calcium/sodium antiporter [Polyangiaceae bacterium]MCW5789488.1 calcium/sodium antiporter [Polyangiaceae bacterium]
MFWFIVGLCILILSAELIIRGAGRLAASLGMPPLILGLTVVSIGTSAPELAVGITANLQGSPGLAVGNIAGTNVFNLLFILGLSACVAPLPLKLQVLRLELPAMAITALMMALLAWDGMMTRLEGVLLVLGAVVYTSLVIRSARAAPPEPNEAPMSPELEADASSLAAPPTQRGLLRERLWYSALLAVGLGLSVLGADWLVVGAVSIARSFGFSDALIGLTVVSVGTSMPELVTTVVATVRGERDVAVGNLIGSSIYNILAILGATAAFSPAGLVVERGLVLVDIPVMVVAVLLCVPIFITGRQVSRAEGAGLVIGYLVYAAALISLRA